MYAFKIRHTPSRFRVKRDIYIVVGLFTFMRILTIALLIPDYDSILVQNIYSLLISIVCMIMLFFELILPALGKRTDTTYNYDQLRKNSNKFNLAMKSPTNVRFFSYFV